MRLWNNLVLSLFLTCGYASDDEEEDVYKTTDPRKREPSPCEVCKFFATELGGRLAESGKSKEVIETGRVDQKKRFAYKTSELRLTEALHEPHICVKILEYNVHAERKGSLRYAKGVSETMSTLHGLVDKGVKVELGIPYDMWDSPSAEVTKMQRACFSLAERYEEDIEDWYYNEQENIPLTTYLCENRYLKERDQTCLFEKTKDTDSVEEGKNPKKKKKKKKGAVNKGDTGSSKPSTDAEKLEL